MALHKYVKQHGGPLLGYALLAILFTFPLILKMNSSMFGAFFNTDMRGSVWGMWWIKYAALHRMPYELCPFLAAPFGLDFSRQPFFPVLYFFAREMVVLTDIFFYFNVCLLASFILTGWFTYLLGLRLTGCKAAAFIAGLIFAFSPYHLNKTMEFGYIFMGNWIVLYLLLLLRLRDHVSFRNVFFCGLSFGLLAAFNQYYAFFAGVATVALICYIVFFERKSFLKKGLRFTGAAIAALGIGILFNAHAIVPIVKNMLALKSTPETLASFNYSRALHYLVSQSARPLSYLLPASTHPVFGDFTKKMFGSIFYGRGPIEQTLYLGWVPLGLAWWALRRRRYRHDHAQEFASYKTSEENMMIGFFVFLAWVAFFFSLPPVVDLGLCKLYFPSYITYKIFPMFRAYARFGIIVMLCVSVLAAYGVSFIASRVKSPRLNILFTGIIFFAIIFEFSNVPPWRVTELSRVPALYRWLTQQPPDVIVAEYPMAKAAPGEAVENYDYLYYQTVHHKRLFNGASPGTKAYAFRERAMILDDPATEDLLRDLGVTYVIVHEDLYRGGAFKEASRVIGEIPNMARVPGLAPVRAFGDTKVYEVIRHG